MAEATQRSRLGDPIFLKGLKPVEIKLLLVTRSPQESAVCYSDESTVTNTLSAGLLVRGH
jgi:hypothetical protein